MKHQKIRKLKIVHNHRRLLRNRRYYRGGEEALEEEISISGNSFCDNTNPDHCLLPFPSSAFLNSDSGTITGYRLDIDGQAIPDSASAESEDFHMLNNKDGHSPSYTDIYDV